MPNNQFIPSSPQNISIRPLNKGIITSLPGQGLANGAMIDIKNYYTTFKGLMRRPGIIERYVTPTTTEEIKGTQAITTSAGVNYSLAWDETDVYKVSAATLVALTPANPLTIADPSATDYCVVDNKVIICDYTHTPIEADGVNTAKFSTDLDTIGAGGTSSVIPLCCAFHKNRVYLGNTIEGATYAHQRIRWSSLTDHESFDQNDFVDLPYGQGELWRLVSLGEYLVAYFEKGIWIGRPTNYVNLPLAFTALETQNVGLVGPKAVYPFIGGHFVIGNDNMYFLTMQGFDGIGTPILQETIRKAVVQDYLEKTIVCVDTNYNVAHFGFPTSSSWGVNEIWTFNYLTNSWSHQSIPNSTMISLDGLTESITWATVTGTWASPPSGYTTWSSFNAPDRRYEVWYGTSNGEIMQNDESLDADYLAGGDGSATVIDTYLETADYDLNQPDIDKHFLQFTLKTYTETDEDFSNDLIFNIQGSVDQGRTWKNFGLLTIDADKREGKINFRMKGSHIRFKITSTSQVRTYTITEFILRYRISGRETKFD